jgi:hypothetical protein
MPRRRRFVVDECIDGRWAQMHDLAMMQRKDAESWQLRLTDQGRVARVREINDEAGRTKRARSE